MRSLFPLSLVFAAALFSVAVPAHSESKPVKIGAVFSLSGWGAGGGTPELNGALLAMEDLGTEKFLDGDKAEIKLEVEDNRSDLRATADAFRKLTSVSGAPIVIGPNWSEFIDVVAPLAVASKVPVLTASGYKEQQVRPDPWVFVLWPPPAVATKTLASYIAAQGKRRIQVLVNENAYMRGVLDAIKPQLEASGVSIVEVSSFNPGHTDYRSVIAKLIRSDTDGVLALLLESGEFAAFMRQRLELKLALPIYAANTLPFDAIVQKELKLAEGLVYFDYNTPGGAAFAARYRTRFKAEPGFGTAKAYDAVMIAVRALHAAGTNPGKIREFLRTVKHDGLSGEISFDEHGVIRNDAANTHLVRVSGGALVPLSAGR